MLEAGEVGPKGVHAEWGADAEFSGRVKGCNSAPWPHYFGNILSCNQGLFSLGT